MPGTESKQEGSGNRKQNRLWKHTLVLAGVGLVFSVFFAFIQPFSFIQLWLSDQLFLTAEPSPNIVVVGIDDETLQTLGKWSEWTRDLHALALNNLAVAGAKTIGFDVLFVDSSADDELLAAVMAEAGNVVLPVAGTQATSGGGQEVTYAEVLVPVSPIREASQNLGHANIIPDSDGKVRRLPLVIRDSAGQEYPSLSLAILYNMASMPLPDSYVKETGNLNLLLRDVPVDKSYSLARRLLAPGVRPPLSLLSGRHHRGLRPGGGQDTRSSSSG
jgi:CHASE2 domain-containing sensor protein